jgi:hypothetical protein
MEFRIALADGTVKHVQGVGRPVVNESGEVDRYIGTTVDISDRKRAETLFVGEKRLLEMIATGVALKEILNVLCMIIEEYRRGTLASILLLRADGLHLDSVAGPSLPKGWIQQMEKLPIGPCVSCSTVDHQSLFLCTDPLKCRSTACCRVTAAARSGPLSSEGKSSEPFMNANVSPSVQDLGLIESDALRGLRLNAILRGSARNARSIAISSIAPRASLMANVFW